MSNFMNASLMLPAGFQSEKSKSKNYRSKSIDLNSLAAWAQNHMYNSSYMKYHSDTEANSKSQAIPGYQGFIPKYKAQNLHAKGFTNMTKDVFGKANYGLNQNRSNSNKFNINKQDLIDHSKNGSSSRYGQSTWLKPHPNWQLKQWKTTTQQTYIDPRQKMDSFFKQSKSLNKQYIKPSTFNNGYSTNRSLLDGTGWKPEKALKAQNVSTEYRDIFNNPEHQQFHRNIHISKIRKLKKVQRNYKFNY